jgi:arylsulfatase A-like enzyme
LAFSPPNASTAGSPTKQTLTDEIAAWERDRNAHQTKSDSLPATEITMAEMLRDAGYATAIFGKWHLGAQSYSQPQNKALTSFTASRPAIPGTRS